MLPALIRRQSGWGLHGPHEHGREGETLSALSVFMAKSNAVSAAPSPAPSEDDYQGESDHHTMMRAAEIRGDKGRMAGVKKHHAKQKLALGKVGRSLSGRR